MEHLLELAQPFLELIVELLEPIVELFGEAIWNLFADLRGRKAEVLTLRIR